MIKNSKSLIGFNYHSFSFVNYCKSVTVRPCIFCEWTTAPYCVVVDLASIKLVMGY